MKYPFFFLASLFVCAVFAQSSQNIPPCERITPLEGEIVFRLREIFYHYLYPETFVIELKPENRCFYIANNMLQVMWNSKQVKGSLWIYGFDGYDGESVDSCKILREVPIDQHRKYFTAFTSFEKSRDYEVCSLVVMLDNTGDRTDRITIGKNSMN